MEKMSENFIGRHVEQRRAEPATFMNRYKEMAVKSEYGFA
jgi:hypothetical protein